MTAILGTTTKIVPFSAFKEGKAGEIFAEVRRSGSAIVIDDAGNQLCAVMSPEDYYRQTKEHNNVVQEALAQERITQHRI